MSRWTSAAVSVIDGSTNAVIAGFGAAWAGVGVAVNPNTNRIYATATNHVKLIDGATNGVVATIAMGTGPVGIGVNPDTNRIYIGSGSNTVSVIDGASNAVVATIPVGTGPVWIGVNPNTNRIYGVNSGSNTMSVIDGATNAVVATVGVGSAIQSDGIDVNPTTGLVYVANRGESTVSVIEDLVEITVDIDIKPGSFPNSINPKSKGKIPVAILTTVTFDATTVDSTTVRFSATGTEAAAVQAALEDVDGDGDSDMILHFNTQDTGIQCGDTSASLTGETLGGQMIEGSDSIKTVGCG